MLCHAMSSSSDSYEGGLLSDDEDDFNIDGLDDIRRACMPEATDADYGLEQSSASNVECDGDGDDENGGGDVEDGIELAQKIENGYSDDVGRALGVVMESDDELADLELLLSIEKKYSIKFNVPQPLQFSKPLSSLPPAEVEEEDDFETLRAIKKRFRAYDEDKGNLTDDPLRNHEGIRSSDISACSKVPTLPSGSQDAAATMVDVLDENLDCHQAVHQAVESSGLSRARSHFPEAANFIIDAIKKNRLSQKIIRCKFIQVEAKIMENKELIKRLEALKDFQTLCRKRTSHALSLKKDPRVLLISVKKVNLKKASVMHFGPEENAHVANYRSVLESTPLSFDRKKWSKEEKENLDKGVRQELQEISNRYSLNIFNSDGSSRDIDYFDNILVSNKFEITPYHIKEFLPKVDWNKLASKYIMGRSGSECQARWLNYENPLINRDLWSSEEDQTLLDIVGEKGLRNWFDISESLNTSRTPFQCLLRYQRSLNPYILNREWTEEEDDKLRAAVERFGERDWQSVASAVEHRTGSQCSNRWKKSLHPERKGSFIPDEDKRLKIAVMFFGLKWKKIAQYLPGRTGAQCRDRYVNSLDPELKWDTWSEEEDARLVGALEKHKFCWSKIAKEVGKRTDGQCRKRWMKLFPEDVPKLQEAKKRKKTIIISNFVDRENERPAFSLDNFLPSPMVCSAPEPGLISKRRKRNMSKVPKKVRNKKRDQQAANVQKIARTRRHKKQPRNHSGEHDTSNEIETYDVLLTEDRVEPHSDNSLRKEVRDHCPIPLDSTLIEDTDNGMSLSDSRGRKKVSNLKFRKNSTEQPLQTIGTLPSGTINDEHMEATYWNNTAIETRRGTFKEHFQDESCTRETSERSKCIDNFKLLTISVSAGDPRYQDAPVGDRDSRNHDEGSTHHVLDTHETDERLSQGLGVDMVLVNNDNHILSSHMGNSKLRMTDGVVNNFSERDISERSEVFRLSTKCRVAGTLKNQGQTKASKAEESPPSQKILETTEEDNLTLAFFLRNILKKRRIQL